MSPTGVLQGKRRRQCCRVLPHCPLHSSSARGEQAGAPSTALTSRARLNNAVRPSRPTCPRSSSIACLAAVMGWLGAACGSAAAAQGARFACGSRAGLALLGMLLRGCHRKWQRGVSISDKQPERRTLSTSPYLDWVSAEGAPCGPCCPPCTNAFTSGGPAPARPCRKGSYVGCTQLRRARSAELRARGCWRPLRGHAVTAAARSSGERARQACVQAHHVAAGLGAARAAGAGDALVPAGLSRHSCKVAFGRQVSAKARRAPGRPGCEGSAAAGLWMSGGGGGGRSGRQRQAGIIRAWLTS